MGRTSRQIIDDLTAYFKDAEVNDNRWKVHEINMKIEKNEGNIEVYIRLKPFYRYNSLEQI